MGNIQEFAIPYTALAFLVLLHVHVQPLSGGPVRPPGSNCSSNEVGLYVSKNGTLSVIRCWKLPGYCALGYGLTVVPGKNYPAGTEIACSSCKPGETFSDKHDLSQCKNCTTCQLNEIAIGQCITDKDSIECTGKCKPGYYKSQDLSTLCKPCSQCCGNMTDEIPTECSLPGIPLAKRCSVETIAMCSSPRNGSSGNSSDSKKSADDIQSSESIKTHKSAARSRLNIHHLSGIPLIVMIFIPLVTISSVTLYTAHRSRRPDGRTDRVLYDHASETTQISQTCFERPTDSTEPLITGIHEVVPVTPPTNDRSIKHETSCACGSSGSSGSRVGPANEVLMFAEQIPNALESSSVGSTCSNISINHNHQSYTLINEECWDGLQVTELPEELYKNVCTMLDEKEDFFRDFRMFAEELLDMEKHEIDSLGQSPTNTILTKHGVSVEEFIKTVGIIGREDVAKVVQSWLGH